ncbi:Uncharacterised protein [Yersinia enterocolitica]|nr:Uncharacterised protein [Yersinia enterocolitica]
MVTICYQLKPGARVGQSRAYHTGVTVMQARHAVETVHQPIRPSIKCANRFFITRRTVAEHDFYATVFKMLNRR